MKEFSEYLLEQKIKNKNAKIKILAIQGYFLHTTNCKTTSIFWNICKRKLRRWIDIRIWC